MTTISYASGTSTVGLLGELIGANLAATAARHPDREALVEVATGRRWTYARFATEVELVARGLLGMGIDKGDRVGIWAPNCAEWVLVQYATARVGAVLVNINPAYRVHELAHALRQSDVRLLVSATSFRSSDYVAMVDEVAERCPTLERTVYIGTESWAALVDAATGVPVGELIRREETLSFDDPINIQYTSGTTGLPKGATLSHHGILNNGYFVGQICGYTPEDRICVAVPLYHCFGMVAGNLAATSHGATIVLPAPSFDPAATLRAVEDERCTSLYGVPTMFIAMLQTPEFAGLDLSSLRTGIMGGSPCPVEVMKRVVEDMGMHDVTICYGMTETSPVSTQTRPTDDLDRRVSTVGTVHPHVQLKVVDPATGLAVPRGTPGELCTRGYSVMLGYWDQPDKTSEVIDAAGWMHSGDLATMDEHGYVNIVGRIKDMVIRGGENISPREIEEFLHAHPDIADVQVVGVPDDRYGEELMAWVRMRDGAASLDAAAVRAFCHGRLSHHKIPRYVHVVTEFPMTATGKVRKVELREQAIGILGLDDDRTRTECRGVGRMDA
jgi:fatty-acyl-CoA synthase